MSKHRQPHAKTPSKLKSRNPAQLFSITILSITRARGGTMLADASKVAFNICAFLSTLFVLEFGADTFVKHTAIVAARIGISPVLVALFTAGAEWEELVVVLGALSQKRPSIALGNVLGSCISNVLGAFSLGLIFYERGSTIEFDRSARIYSLVLLALTTVVIPVLHHPTPIVWLVFGPVLIAAFGVYFFVAATAIVQGILTAPEDSDSDSDSSSMYIRDDSDSSDESGDDNAEPSEATALLPRRRAHSLGYHAAYLLFGFSAICLAGYVLSQAAIHIVDALEISDVLFSVIVLALATTLPEKFIAVLSGRLGQPGILVANCAGSNIFLLSLCCGVVMTSSKGELNGGNVAVFELAALWVSTAGFAATVWFGARYARWVGGVMVVAYLVFIVLEFTVVHKSHASMKAVTG